MVTICQFLNDLKVRISCICQAHFQIKSRIPGTELICGGLRTPDKVKRLVAIPQLKCPVYNKYPQAVCTVWWQWLLRDISTFASLSVEIWGEKVKAIFSQQFNTHFCLVCTEICTDKW